MNKQQRMYQAIERHGLSLLAAFPDATERDPVTLSKKLRRIEVALAKPILDNCNLGTEAAGEALDAAVAKALPKVRKLLGITPEDSEVCGLFVNTDPRGYALKLGDAWVREWNFPKDKPAPEHRIHTDWGGYGILAPDFSNE